MKDHHQIFPTMQQELVPTLKSQKTIETKNPQNKQSDSSSQGLTCTIIVQDECKNQSDQSTNSSSLETIELPKAHKEDAPNELFKSSEDQTQDVMIEQSQEKHNTQQNKMTQEQRELKVQSQLTESKLTNQRFLQPQPICRPTHSNQVNPIELDGSISEKSNGNSQPQQEGNKILKSKVFLSQKSSEPKIDWQPKKGEMNSYLRKEHYVNLSPFPTEFRNEDDALLSYNDFGQWHKIQFKLSHRKRNDAGVVVGFTLCCTKRNTRSFQKIDQGLQLRDQGGLNCQVQVRFKWRPDRNLFVRSTRMIMHHTHELDIKERSNINNKNIQSEIQLYTECKIPVHQIHTLISEKYHTNVSFEQIFHMVLNIQSGKRKESQSDIQQFLTVLEEMKQKDPQLRFAFEFDEGEFKSDIYQMIVQTAEMRRNYRLYHDVVFMDATYKTNNQQMALSVISGINHEGKNIVLGFALVKRETMDTYKWILQNLQRFNEGLEPGVLLTDYDASMCGAIEGTLKNTTHLLCQWHMQQNLKKHFLFLKRMQQGHSKLLYKHIVYDLLYDENPKNFEAYINVIFQSQDLIGEAKLNYLRNLLQIKEKWSAAYSPVPNIIHI